MKKNSNIELFETDEVIEDAEEFDGEIEKINLAETNEESSTKSPEEIMDKYNKGKFMATRAEAIIRSILNLDESKKIPNIILKPEKVEDYLAEAYDQAVKEYNEGMQMTLQAKEEMIIKLDMFIYYVIEGRFSTFKKYTKDLYQEGILGILKGIDSYDASKSKPTTYSHKK